MLGTCGNPLRALEPPLVTLKSPRRFNIFNLTLIQRSRSIYWKAIFDKQIVMKKLMDIFLPVKSLDSQALLRVQIRRSDHLELYLIEKSYDFIFICNVTVKSYRLEDSSMKCCKISTF